MEKIIVVSKKINPKNPIFIAAWPGMGYVATKAVNFLKDKLQAQLFAKMQPEEFFNQTDIAINNSVIQISPMPTGKFYYWENKFGKNDLIIFISEAQPPIEKSIAYAEVLLDFIQKLKVKMVVTFAAMLTSMEHTQVPKVWLAVTTPKLISEFQGIDARPMESGQISGLNGLLLGIAKKRKLQGACFLGEIPFYAGQIENPRSSMMVLSALTKFLNIKLDLNELSLAGKVMEEEIARLMEHFKDSAFPDDHEKPITTDDIEKIRNILANQSQIPNSAKRQIEDLFLKAKEDVACALELKRKLDEWNVYKEYEDRFLELFKRADDRDN